MDGYGDGDGDEDGNSDAAARGTGHEDNGGGEERKKTKRKTIIYFVEKNIPKNPADDFTMWEVSEREVLMVVDTAQGGWGMGRLVRVQRGGE